MGGASPNSIHSKVFCCCLFAYFVFIIHKKKTSRCNIKRLGNASVRG